MGKIKSFFIAAAAAACPVAAICGGTVGQAVYTAAYISSGAIPDEKTDTSSPDTSSVISKNKTESNSRPEDSYTPSAPAAEDPANAAHVTNTSYKPDETSEPVAHTEEITIEPDSGEVISQTYEPEKISAPETEEINTLPEGQPAGRVISQNIEDFYDGLDLSAEGTHSGDIARVHYQAADTGDYVKLHNGGETRNCTDLSAETLAEASKELPGFKIEGASSEPQVLIMHTHTTESYEPYERNYYDINFPSRTRSVSRNMTAVGEALAKSLAAGGITVLHDGTIHDYPVYTGAYDRSEETIRKALEEYPSIKVVIDLHRDAIENPDGTRIAPVSEVNGKNAAQYMIIAGCDDGRFNMPNYMENFKFACLIQSCSEELYPGLARPLLFDYRNYNQHLTTGSLLIEVGSHANSFDEALYTGELLGNVLARALQKISE